MARKQTECRDAFRLHDLDRRLLHGGLLWEHLVLDVLRVCTGGRNLFYWRYKSDREVDFVVTGPEGQVHTIECKLCGNVK